ncbi:hypothetical protein PSACC_00440 [Paramicrosporidium saccamoebae]|uniref:Tetraspanin n=1 Tax=Paramicrosporidium saccamoebae TaxID=1246581 RepID=A0A2H9TPX4_9FUNG|nr:hypothetical protein PSACC_00440 [Paramicrosporidium saccamoebae]
MTRKKKKIAGNPTDQPSHRNFTMISTTEATAEPVQRMPPYTVHPDPDEYQMEPIGNISQPPSPPDSLDDVEKGQPRGKKPPCGTLLQGIMALMLLAGFVLGVLCVVAGAMVRQYPNLQADQSLWFISTLIILLGVFFMVTAISGFVSCFSSKKIFTAMFIVFTIVLVAYHGLATFRIKQHLGAVQSAGSADWDRLKMPQRLGLQYTFDCCGYDTKSDRMVAPCPTKATVSCGKKLEGLVQKMRRTATISFYITLAIGIVLCIMAITNSCFCTK